MRIGLVTSIVMLAICAGGEQYAFAGQSSPENQPTSVPTGETGHEDDRPHGRLFISPMGEPFRGSSPADQWFAQADTNHDGALTLAEFSADASRFFAMLDRGHDGEIDPDDIEYYETVLAPEIRVGGYGGGGHPGGGHGSAGGGHRGGGHGGGGHGGGRRGGAGGFGGDSSDESPQSGTTRETYGKQGAARFSYFDYPEPVTVADRNFNRGVDKDEFQQAAADRFAQLDKNGDGRIAQDELPRISLDFHGHADHARQPIHTDSDTPPSPSDE